MSNIVEPPTICPHCGADNSIDSDGVKYIPKDVALASAARIAAEHKGLMERLP